MSVLLYRFDVDLCCTNYNSGLAPEPSPAERKNRDVELQQRHRATEGYQGKMIGTGTSFLEILNVVKRDRAYFYQ